jgi:hypothetical protein
MAGGLAWIDSACARGADGSSDFDPGTGPPAGEFYYFVIVGNNGTSEGSYGKNSSSAERPNAAPAVDCFTQQLTGACP